MEKDNRILNIIKHKIGTWEFTSNKVNLKVMIGDNKVILIYNGQKEEFTSKGDWWPIDTYYIFSIPESKYFIYSADEQQLVFGKNSSKSKTVIVEWQYTLQRVG